jgi:hypothetical protein
VATIFVCLIFVHFLVSLYTLYSVSEGTSTTRRGYLGVLHDSIRFPSLSLRGFAFYSNGDMNIGSLPSSNLIATVIRSPMEVDAALVLGYSLRQSVSCLDHMNSPPAPDLLGSSGSDQQATGHSTSSSSSRVYCISRVYYDPALVDVRAMPSTIHNATIDLTVKLQQAGWMEVTPLNVSLTQFSQNDLFTSLFLEFEDPRFRFRQLLYLSPRSYCNTDLTDLFDAEKSMGLLLPHYAPAATADGPSVPELTVLCLTASDFYLDGSEEPVLFVAVPIPGMRRHHQAALRFSCRGNLATAERFAPSQLVGLSKASRRRAQLQRKGKIRDYDWWRHVADTIPLGFFALEDFRAMMRSVALTNTMQESDDVEKRLWWEMYEAAAEHARRRFTRSMFWSSAQLWTARAGSTEGQLVAVGTEAESLLPPLQTLYGRLNLTSPQMKLLLGRPGESCLQTCASINYGCAPKALDWWLPNSCEMLRRLFSECDKCTVDLNSKGLGPAYRPADNLCVARYPRSPVRSACNASNVAYARACTCFETSAQFSAVVRPLAAEDMKDLLEDSMAEKSLGDVAARRLARVDPPGGVPSLSPQGEGTSVNDKQRKRAAKQEEEAASGPCPCPEGTAFAATEEQEWVCLSYISNLSNVVKIQPMLSNVKFGRTAKFEISYARSCVRAVAKPPQKSFPLEPYAEYVAFEIDRLLEMKYVPPTSWLFLPLMQLESSAETFKNGAKAGADAAKSYATWLSEEVMEYAIQRRLTAIDPHSHKMVLGCSVQLWVDGARWHRGTPLEYDDAYISLLTAESARLYKAKKLFTTPAVRQSILNTPAKLQNVELVLPYLSDTVVFDTILANDDRSSQKNSHVYRNSLENGQYLFLHIDQGKSFYQHRVVSKFTLNDLDDDPSKDAVGFQSVCMFRTKTATLLRQLSNGGLMRRLVDLVPAPIRQQFSNNQLHWAQGRVDALQRHVDLCVKILGDDVANPWA